MSLPPVPQFPQLTAARRFVFQSLALLAGCGAVPIDYHPGTEIPPGPGMFTGERGALVFCVDLAAAGNSANPVRKRTSPDACASYTGITPAE